MQRWEEAVRREIPAARNTDVFALRDSLPEYLRGISFIISTEPHTPTGQRFWDEFFRISRIHGIVRAASPGYTLDQVIGEYRILRRTVLHFLEGELTESFKEREKILEAIDNGLIQAATEFASHKGFRAARLRDARQQVDEAEKKLSLERRRVDDLVAERLLREQFVSSLSHDLCTPLTAIQAAGDLILKEADQGAVVRKLAIKILEGCSRINRMIKDLLDASQIEAGKCVQLKIEACNLETLTREVLNNLATIHGDRLLLTVKGDQNGFWSPSDLQRVIENLVVNGLKYGQPAGTVTVNLVGASHNLTIAVHNEGNPISPEQQPILFQPYRRLFSAQMGGKGGWGLGLTVVRGIVESHGGSVSVDSHPSRGTTFTVSIPRDSRPYSSCTAA